VEFQVINYTQSPIEQKKFVKFGPLAKKFCCLISTYPKSTLRIMRMLMHLSAGHEPLLPWEFHQPP